jgi:hypothetical protein
VAARERGLVQPPLLLVGETAISCLAAATSLRLLPWRSGGVRFILVEASARVCLRAPRELLSGGLRRMVSVTPSGLKGVGHHSLCFARRACFAAADDAVAVEGDLVGSRDDAPRPDHVLFIDLGSFLHFCRASL